MAAYEEHISRDPNQELTTGTGTDAGSESDGSDNRDTTSPPSRENRRDGLLVDLQPRLLYKRKRS